MGTNEESGLDGSGMLCDTEPGLGKSYDTPIEVGRSNRPLGGITTNHA